MNKNDLSIMKCVVKHILETDERARVDDNYLFLKVCQHKAPRVKDCAFGYVFEHSDLFNLPVMDSITRARRKIFEENPELAVDKRQIRHRENEKVHKDFFGKDK